MARLFTLAAALLVVLAGVQATHAQSSTRSAETAGEEKVELPTDPRLWHNSPPLSLDSLAGKGVVFYFFEEESPEVAARWPALQTMASQYQGKPIFFVAVNSGTDPKTIRRYLSAAQVGWPVIHDFDRSLENLMGVPKLTANGELYAVRYATPEGKIVPGNATDFAATAEAALKGATWRVDPAEVPPPLRKAWRAIELGDFTSASRAVVKAADGKDKALKAGGEKLRDAVKEEFVAGAKQAQEAIKKKEEWKAYQTLDALQDRFDGYGFELMERVEERHKQLADLPAVKDEIAAKKMLDKAISAGSKRTSSATKRAKSFLNRVVSDYPTSEAAAKAREYLAAIE